MNIVMLTGHLGANPEARKTDSGNTLCKFPVATNKRWTGDDGQPVERTDWHRITVFGRQGEACMEYLRKGSHVAIHGELRTSTWEDDDGNNRRSVEVVGRRVEFLDAKPDDQGEQPVGEFNDDDIPF